jgi:hypothetical protein
MGHGISNACFDRDLIREGIMAGGHVHRAKTPNMAAQTNPAA